MAVSQLRFMDALLSNGREQSKKPRQIVAEQQPWAFVTRAAYVWEVA
jgi:hypothetical protein